MKRALVFGLAITVAGCRCNSDPSTKPVTTEKDEDVIVPALPTSDIGMRDVPTATSNTQWDDALDKYGKGDFSGARRVLVDLVKLAPDFQKGRWKLALAHAKVGAFDDAAKELSRLLAEDYRDYQARIGRENDLATFRASPAGLAIRRRSQEIEAAYNDAAARGLRTFMWKGWAERGNLALHTDVLRLGVFLPDTKRFVPLTPSVESAYAIAVDDDATTEVVVDFQMNPVNGSGGAVGQRIDRCGISVGTFANPSAPRFRWEGSCTEGLLVSPDKQSALFARTSLEGQPAAWQRLTREATKPEPGAAPKRVVDVRTRGVAGASGWGAPWADARKAAYDGRGVVVDGGAPIPLETRHMRKDTSTSAWSSPDGRRVLVLSNIEGTDPRIKTLHIVSLVDLDKREATVLHEGDGPASAAFASDGTIYLQTDRRLRRRAPGATSWEPLPGLLIAQPVIDAVVQAHEK